MSEQIIIRQATKADLPGAVEALVDAFKKDPVMSRALGGQMRIRRLRALFTFQIEHHFAQEEYGIIDVAVDDQGTVLGAALWESPERKNDLMKDLHSVRGYAKALKLGLARAALVEVGLLRARPVFTHWYLYCVGVHGSDRGKGVGGALLEYRCQQLGEYPAYLEASNYDAAALYRRHGFIEMGGFGKLSNAVLGMWRPSPVSAIDKNRGKR